MSVNDPYGQVRASIIEQQVYEASIRGLRSLEMSPFLQQFLDYTDRTDGQPTYMGFAERGLAQSASAWLLQKYTYDASGKFVNRQIAMDEAWSDRASATYA